MSGVSNGYISMLERETRNPPSPDILRRLASIYAVPAIELMRKAGILKPEDEGLDEENKLERAFQTVLSDPGFQHGTRLEGKMSRDVKLFIVEMYQKATGRKLL